MGGSQLPDLTLYRIRSEKESNLRGEPVGSGSRIRIKRGSRITIEGSGIGILATVDPDQEWDTGSRSKSRGDPVGSGSRIRIKRGSKITIEGSGIGILAKVDPDQEWDTGSRSTSRGDPVGSGSRIRIKRGSRIQTQVRGRGKSRGQRSARDRGA